MIVKSRGIVLSYMKYGDTSIIARVFTEEAGYGSFIVNSIRSQKSKKSIGHFQPFSILDLVLYVKETRDLQRISEFRNHFPLHNLHYDPVKSAITLFLTEIFSKLLQAEQSPNPSLFAFAVDSIQSFDAMKEGTANFHLQFLLKVGPFLGFAIEEINDLFHSTDRLAPSTDIFQHMGELIEAPYGTTLEMNREMRNKILDEVINYYRHHAHISKPKSI